ncbi:SUMF1/EgtB/PvdO family nonheme iron enzyme, partial [Verrucomicrobiota bacterium]
MVWSTSSNATGYRVWRNLSNDTGSASSIGTSASTNYNDTTGSAGTLYYYWVKSTNSMSVSEFSANDTGWRAVAEPWQVVRDMCFIPPGSFQMGDPSGIYGAGSPVHTNFISAFYIDRHHITKATWDTVYQWALSHGYDFDNAGAGAASNHPAININWYSAVKWCNARSEMEGYTPAYYTGTVFVSTAVYRTGSGEYSGGPYDLMSSNVDWNANGYRLPTDAEWEKAARGGLNGHFFPWSSQGGVWSNHIDGTKANYKESGDPYDNATPYKTTPVGYYSGDQVITNARCSYGGETQAVSDMANGYGLYDMAGNINVWVWDKYKEDYYIAEGRTDPRGPDDGANRVLRGGSCIDPFDGHVLQCVYRNAGGMPNVHSDVGLRCILKLPKPDISATDGEYTNKVRVTWSGVSGATGYEVWRNLSNDTGSASSIGTSATTNYDDTSVGHNTNYYYWVKSTNSVLISAFSENDTGYCKVPAPTGISATDGEYTDKVRLTWNSATGATGYEVWRNTANSTGTATRIGTNSTSPYDDISAGHNTNYYYWVKSTNSVSTSAFSENDTGYRKVPAPTGISATDGEYTDKVRVTWTGETGATGYEVWRNTVDNSGTAANIGSSSASPYDDATTGHNTNYYYWVKSTNSLGQSSFSDPDTGWLGFTAVSGVSASDGTYTDKIRIIWDEVEGATGYEVLRNTTGDSGSAITNGTTAATSHDDTSAEVGTNYYYWVKATNAVGFSALSSNDSGWRA